MILLVTSLFSLVITPAELVFSRHLEHEADRFALEMTQTNHSAGTAFVKLQQDALAVPYPGLLFKLTRATHLSLGERIEFSNDYHSVETHVSYNLTLRAWAAWDMTWYGGGRQSLNGVPKTSRQDNTRMGATVSLPVGQRHTVKFAYSWDVSTSAGRGFNAASIGFQTGWLSR